MEKTAFEQGFYDELEKRSATRFMKELSKKLYGKTPKIASKPGPTRSKYIARVRHYKGVPGRQRRFHPGREYSFEGERKLRRQWLEDRKRVGKISKDEWNKMREGIRRSYKNSVML